MNGEENLLPVRYLVAEPSFERWPFATQLSLWLQRSALWRCFCSMLCSIHAQEPPFNCPYNLGYYTAFRLTNTSSALLPSSSGGHRLALCVLLTTATIHPVSPSLTAGLTVSKLPKHLSATCKYWHKHSDNGLLNLAWWRAALGKECAICRSLHRRATASTARFPFCSYTTPRRSVTDAVRGHCRFFFPLSKSVSSPSPLTSMSSHPHSIHCLHPVILARTAWL